MRMFWETFADKGCRRPAWLKWLLLTLKEAPSLSYPHRKVLIQQAYFKWKFQMNEFKVCAFFINFGHFKRVFSNPSHFFVQSLKTKFLTRIESMQKLSIVWTFLFQSIQLQSFILSNQPFCFLCFDLLWSSQLVSSFSASGKRGRPVLSFYSYNRHTFSVLSRSLLFYHPNTGLNLVRLFLTVIA